MSDKENVIVKYNNPLSWVIHLATAIVGYHINNQSVFWAIIDWIFCPIVWLKWVICGQVNIHVIKEAFQFFFN